MKEISALIKETSESSPASCNMCEDATRKPEWGPYATMLAS